MLKRFYIDGPFGQLHCRQWGQQQKLPPLICLSPSPFSGEAFLTLAPLLSTKLATQRSVIAIDYPGFGSSDAIEGETSIDDLAECVLSVIAQHSPTSTAALFGFHTGCLVAVEAALKAPTKVEQLVICDVPFFSPEKQAELLEQMPATVELGSQLAGLEKAWDFCVSSKLEHIPLKRAYQIFIDYISPGETVNRVFRAAFNYPCAARFKLLNSPTVVIATKSMLHQPSVKAAGLISQSTLIDAQHITIAVLEKGASKIADLVVQYL